MMSLRKFFRRRHTDAELQEEMSNHLAAEIEDYLACGYSYDEARRAALVKFGNLQQVRERLWRQNTISWLDNLWRNLKQSARSLRRPTSAVSPSARWRKAAAAATPPRACARPAHRSSSSASVSSGPTAAAARCHARRSGSMF